MNKFKLWLKIFLGRIFPPKESAYIRGYNWAKVEHQQGFSDEWIESYIYGVSDEFDKGAAAFLRELNND